MTRQPLRVLGIVAVGVLGFCWFLRPIWSIDIFMHVAIGREILAHGIPSTDVFSAADPTAPWTPFQMGYEALVAWVDGWAGLDGLRFLHAGVLACCLALFCRFAAGQARRWTTSLLLVVLFLLLFDERVRLRPHVFNLLFEVLFLLPLAAGAWRRAPRRWLWLCLPVAFVWACIHAMGVLWLVAVLGAWLVAGRDSGERRWAAGALALSCVGILLAPGAPGGILHVLAIQDTWLEFVPELAPSWAYFGFGTAYGSVCGLLPIGGALAVVAAAASRPPRERWATILVAAGLSFGSLWLIRLVYYAAFVFVLVLPELRTLARRALGRPLPRWPAALAALALAALLLHHASARLAELGVRNPWTTTLYPGVFPVEEAAALRAAGVEGRIFNDPNWGGYLLYALHPPSTVLTDGRITFSREVGELILEAGRPGRLMWALTEAHARFGVDLAVLRTSPSLPRGKTSDRACVVHEGRTFCWERILQGATAEVWSPAGPLSAARRKALARVAPPAGPGASLP